MTEPTDAELKAMWQPHAADIGGIFCYARAVLAKWGPPAQQAPAGESLRTDALCDLSYSHGLKAGWNYCASDDLAGFERAQKIGIEALRALKSTTAQPAPGEQNESAYQRGYMDGMAKGRRDVDAAPQQPVAREPLTDWDMRGQLAASLHCWHRLTANEAEELVAFVQRIAANGIKGGQHVE